MPTWTPGAPGTFRCVQPAESTGWRKEGPGLLGKGVEQRWRDNGTGLAGLLAGPLVGKFPSSFSQALFWNQKVGCGEGARGERLWVSRLLMRLHLYS